MLEFPFLLLIGFAAFIFLLKNWKVVVWLIATLLLTYAILDGFNRALTSYPAHKPQKQNSHF